MNGRNTLALLAFLALGLAGVAGCKSPGEEPAKQAEGHYLKGTSEYLQGHFDAALAEFAEVKKLSPDDPRLPAAMGEVYLAQGKLPDARKEFEAAVLRAPKRATNWSRLGYIQAQLGEVDAARASLERALSLNPKDFDALEQRAELSLKLGDPDAAVRDFAAAARASPDLNKPGLYLRAINLLEKRNRRKEALALLDEAVKGGVKSAEIFSLMGELKVREGDLPGAAEAYKQAALLSPKDPGYWELVGRIRARLDQPDEAASAYRESLKVKDRVVVHVELARLALERDDREDASAELDKALAAGATDDATAAETEELAELLLAFDRKQDALKLYALLASEPEAQKNAALQRKTAQLAKELKDAKVLQAACERVATIEGKQARCP